jgi:hypothetical protein
LQLVEVSKNFVTVINVFEETQYFVAYIGNQNLSVLLALNLLNVFQLFNSLLLLSQFLVFITNSVIWIEKPICEILLLLDAQKLVEVGNELTDLLLLVS